jgi:hypothetical protein
MPGESSMPIVPPEISGVTPYRITKCRPTRIRATGYSTAFAPTAAAAHREAAVAARVQRERATSRLLKIRCPPKGGCAAGCRQGRTMKMGYGIRRSAARKWGNGWYVSVTAYYIFMVYCHCRD